MNSFFGQNQENYYKLADLIAPDIDYELQFVVGMTYSLDFKAMLLVLLALNGKLEDNLTSNKYALLESINENKGKVAIFCNTSGIKMPKKVESYYAFLDDSIFSIDDKNIANFHPKLYIALYKNNDGKEKIKVIVMSKNLTLDQSLDAVIAIDADVKDKDYSKEDAFVCKPLIDMLEYVKKYSNEQKCEKIKVLQKKLKNVESFNLGNDFEECEFVPVGIDDYNKNGYKLTEKAKRLLIISPFLSDNIIEKITQGVDDKILITRADSVTQKIQSLYTGSDDKGKSNNKIYIVKESFLNKTIGDDICDVSEEELSEDINDNTFTRDIHAKIIFNQTDDADYLSLGSLNATNNAYERNVEFMIKLKCKKEKKDNYDIIIQSLFDKKINIFEEYKGSAIKKPADHKDHSKELNEAIKKIKNAKVEKKKETYIITFESSEDDEKILIAPLYALKQEKKLKKTVKFDNLKLEQLSDFYRIRYKNEKDAYDELVIKVETKDIEKMERDKAIKKTIISNSDSFNEYIRYLIADSNVDNYLYNKIYENNKHEMKHESIVIQEPAVYEYLLEYAAKKPEKISYVSELSNDFDNKVVKKEFRELIGIFNEAIEDEE